LATFLEALGDTVRNGFCFLSRTGQDWGLGLEVEAGWRGVDVSLNLLRFAQRLTCNREPDPGLSPPFVGGQCNANYFCGFNFNYQLTDGSPTTVNRSTNPLPGPIGAPSLRFNTGGLVCDIPTANGVFEVALISNVNQASFIYYNISDFSVLRADGQPDNCGQPFPVFPPSAPGDRTYGDTITYINNEGDEVELDVTHRYGNVTFNSNGDLYVPVQIELPDEPYSFTFMGDLNLSTGGFAPTLNNPNYTRGGNKTPDDYVPDDTPTVPPDIPEPVTPLPPNIPEEESQSILRAVIVTVTETSETNTEIAQGDNPTIYAPNLGFVSFYISASGQQAWTSDIPVKNKSNFIPCPWEGGALDVAGTPRPGVVWSLTPVYAVAQQSSQFG